MKKIFLLGLLVHMSLFACAQDENAAKLYYEIHGAHSRSISQGDLKKAQTLTDINEGFPASWIKAYKSVVISARCNGKLQSAKGKGEKLNTDQLNIVRMADPGSEIEVDVRYIPDNQLRDNGEKTINFSFRVLPEAAAEYPGGNEAMMQYLKENIERKMPASVSLENLKWIAIKFVIDTDGKISVLKTIDSTGSEDFDKVIMDAICDMPTWKPSMDSKQRKVAQEMDLVLGPTSKICTLNLYLGGGSFN